MPHIKIEKELKDMEVTLRLRDEGGIAIVHLPLIGVSETALTAQEVEHAKSLMFRASQGRIQFEEGEPADVLSLASESAALSEEQARLLDEQKEELANTQRALDNANTLNSNLQNELQDTNHELSVVRQKLKESESLQTELDVVRNKLRDAETETRKLSSQNEAHERIKKDLEMEIRNLKTSLKAAGEESAPKPDTAKP